MVVPDCVVVVIVGKVAGTGGSLCTDAHPVCLVVQQKKKRRVRSPRGPFTVGEEGKDGCCSLRLEGRSGKVTWAVRRQGEWVSLTSRSPLAQDRWVHLAVVGTTLGQCRLYFDGCLEASSDVPPPKRMVRLRHYIGTSTWYVQGVDVSGNDWVCTSCGCAPPWCFPSRVVLRPYSVAVM